MRVAACLLLASLLSTSAFALTPLFEAIRNHDDEQVKVLLRSGVSPDTIDPEIEFPPLAWAVHNSNENATRVLMDAGASHAAYNPAIFAAVTHNLPTIFTLLADAGADTEQPDRHSWTLLFRAVNDGQLEIVRDLVLKRGANVNHHDGRGRSALGLSRFSFHKELAATVEITNLLLDHGADPKVIDAYGMSILSYFTNTLRPDVDDAFLPSLVERVVRLGASIDYQTGIGYSPLMYATWVGRQNTVKKLVQLGATVNLRDKAGKTALTIAKEQNFAEIVSYLQQMGGVE